MPEMETVRALNDLLQGEYMAVESFNNFIARVKDKNIKDSFKEVQQQHRKNINILADYIQNIGGKPEENLGLKGKMGEIKLNMGLNSDVDSNTIIEKAIEGEVKGVNMAEKILRGNLDNKSREIAGEILKNDRESIDKLRKLIDQW